MVCVTITITHSGTGTNAVIGFTSSVVDGSYAEGSQLWDGVMTDKVYLETIAIPATLAYLNPKWVALYGRDMVISDICGYEIKTDNTVLYAIAIAAFLVGVSIWTDMTSKRG